MTTPAPTSGERPAASPPAADQPHTSSKADPGATNNNPSHANSTPDARELVDSLRQLEQAVNQVREQLDRISRERTHRDFSIARLLGAMLQAIVIGLLVVAVADWVFAAPPARQLVTLAFAGVLQLAALTAISAARSSS